MGSGEVGVRAVRPVIIGDSAIIGGEKLQVKDKQRICLCRDDMTVVTEYEFQLHG
jgi:hypothetical protein